MPKILQCHGKIRLPLPTSTCAHRELCFFVVLAAIWKCKLKACLTFIAICLGFFLQNNKNCTTTRWNGWWTNICWQCQKYKILWWVLAYEEQIFMWKQITKENNDFATQAWRDEVQEKQAWNSRIDVEEKWSWCSRINGKEKLRRRRRALRPQILTYLQVWGGL